MNLPSVRPPTKDVSPPTTATGWESFPSALAPAAGECTVGARAKNLPSLLSAIGFEPKGRHFCQGFWKHLKKFETN